MSKNEPTILDLMKPFIQALPANRRAEAEAIVAMEVEGVLRWAVESGYLLWSRQHPGEIPTKEQMAPWLLYLHLMHRK